MLTPCVLLKVKSRTCLFPILPGLASPEARSGSPRSARSSAERKNSTVSVRRQDQGASTAGVLTRSSVRPRCLSIVAFSPPDPAGVKTPSAKRRARRTGGSRGPAHAVPPALRPSRHPSAPRCRTRRASGGPAAFARTLSCATGRTGRLSPPLSSSTRQAAPSALGGGGRSPAAHACVQLLHNKRQPLFKLFYIVIRFSLKTVNSPPGALPSFPAGTAAGTRGQVTLPVTTQATRRKVCLRKATTCKIIQETWTTANGRDLAPARV